LRRQYFKSTVFSLVETSCCKSQRLEKLPKNATKPDRNRPKEYEPEDGPWDPLTGLTTAFAGSLASLVMSFIDVPIEVLRAFKSSELLERSVMKVPPDAAKHSEEGNGTKLAAEKPQLSSTNASAEVKPPIKLRMRRKPFWPRKKKDQHLPDNLAGELCGTWGPKPTRRQVRAQSSRDRTITPFTVAAQDVSLDLLSGSGKAAINILLVGLKLPLNFLDAVARGFHNAPRLYGDRTVREPAKVVDFHSGVKMAGHEFVFGVFDAATGTVTQPMLGAKESGTVGFLKGVGKGFGGLLIKPGAALFGLPAYTLKGIYKEIQNLKHIDFTSYITAARTQQGEQDWKQSTAEDRVEVIERWDEYTRKLEQEARLSLKH
jgi:hypothetical protein